jgi:hypothetical protein
MAITLPAKRSKLDAFAEAAPDAKRDRKLRGRKAPITLTLPPDLIEQFDAAASRHERSRAAMLAIVMREWLSREAA